MHNGLHTYFGRLSIFLNKELMLCISVGRYYSTASSK